MDVFSVIVTTSVVGSTAWMALMLILRNRRKRGEQTEIKSNKYSSWRKENDNNKD